MLRLPGLTPEDLYVLLGKLRHVQAGGDPTKYLLPDEALHAFMEHCQKRVGEAYFRTPRTTITAFVSLLAVLEQNPGTDWRALLGTVEVKKDAPGDTADSGATAAADPTSTAAAPAAPATTPAAAPAPGDDLTTFKL